MTGKYAETEPADPSDPMQVKRAELNRQYQAVVGNPDAKAIDLLGAYVERSRAELGLLDEEEALMGADDTSLMAKLVEDRDVCLQMLAGMAEIAVEIAPALAAARNLTDSDKYRK